MNKKITVLLIGAALTSAIFFSACGGDKDTAATTTAVAPVATTSAAASNQETSDTNAPETSKETDNADTGSGNEDGIPKEGDMYKGKKVAYVEKVPDCDDDKHGVYYIYDENDELIEAKKY